MLVHNRFRQPHNRKSTVSSLNPLVPPQPPQQNLTHATSPSPSSLSSTYSSPSSANFSQLTSLNNDDEFTHSDYSRVRMNSKSGVIGGSHHRPRIKLKSPLFLAPAEKHLSNSFLDTSTTTTNTPTPTSSLRWKMKSPQLLTMILHKSALLLILNLLLLTFGLSPEVLPGACASSITITPNHSHEANNNNDNLHHDLNQLVRELNEEESNLLKQDMEERAAAVAKAASQQSSLKKQTSESDNGGDHVISSDPVSPAKYPGGDEDETGRDYFIKAISNSIITEHNSGRLRTDELNINAKIETPTATILALHETSIPSTSPVVTSSGNTDRIPEATHPTATSPPSSADLPNFRPVAHFSSEQTEEPSQKSDKLTFQLSTRTSSDRKTSKNSLDMVQGDQPSERSLSYLHQDNNSEGLHDTHDDLQLSVSSSQKASHRSIKSHKSKSLPQPLNPGANDPHELSHLSNPHHQVIIVGKSLPLDEHHGLHTHTTPTTPFNFHHNHLQSPAKNSTSRTILGLTTNLKGQSGNTTSIATSKNVNAKPRRLESLSHGINKNRIINSIQFEDEPSESAYNSLADTSAGLTNTVVLEPSSKSIVKESYKNSSNGVLPYRRSPLQIRRDLSRLVQAAAANAVTGTGNGIDDDIGSLSSKCDRLYISTPNGPRNGTFESPSLALEEGHLYQCILMFVTRPNERVEITFRGFKVRGTPPECVHEWVDIWTEVEGTDPTDLITTPFSGRYCGKIPPRKRISLYGGIAIGFYSDRNVTDETIFHGTYSFINESRYIVGTPVPRTLCSYTILASSNKGVGELLSPTYPGVYPKNLSCSYKFIGSPGQRIRIEFRDFDVFFGGAHCPFDDVKIYDGDVATSPLIGTYCGQQRNLVVYSSEHMMLVTFTTLDRNTDSQNRGFNAVYEFSNSFVKLDFIEKNLGDHIRGTECDQRILSKGRSSGVIYSPNYPFPYLPKIVCRYFIYGLQDPQNLERVRLSFDMFDVPSNTNSAEDENNQSESKRCGDGFLKIYLKGQEVIQAYDKADYEFCGKEIPQSVVSDGPRLVLVFSSGEAQGSGFKAKYKFETEYRIPGTESPDGCHFTYYSSSKQKGDFNSPRFPSNYPTQTNCTYIFVQNPNEQVRIVFDNFKLRADKFNYTDRGAYGSSCEEDWVEIWNVMSSQDDRLVGRYCGLTAPGPIESKEKAVALKVIMWTDEEGVYSGFKARYTYFTADSPFGNCGRNITQLSTGVLTSPKWPGKYDGPSKLDGSAACNWYLNVRPGSRVMLLFTHFSIEGEPAGRGCPAAAVRIWEDPEGVPVELCGETLLNENRQYVSLRNSMRVTFITADKAVGAPGFQAVWTEVQDGASGVPCHPSYFRCARTQFCIPSELRCDETHNCGFNNGEDDRSDEEECGIEFPDINFVISIGMGLAAGVLVIIILCAWGQRRRRRRRRRLQLRRPPIHVCDNAGARFAAMDSV